MDRQTISKRPSIGEGDSLAKKANVQPGVPPEALPTWTALPLDSKLPMIPGPKGAVTLFTTGLGEKVYKSPLSLDFDLTDPNSVLVSYNDYKVLHDPHLKTHLNAPPMKRCLYREGFITHEGKVICTLREFNEYRRYLRKINLALERKKDDDKAHKERHGKRKKKTEESITKMRETKVREIRERLAKQHEEDKNRYIKLKHEEDERRERLREEQMYRMSSKEKEQREKQEHRRHLIRRRQNEDKCRKMEMLHQWFEEDRRRAEMAEARRRSMAEEKQKKLEESWEQRKRIQQEHLELESRRREEARENTRRRIEQREKQAIRRQERKQAIFIEMTEQYRREKERLEHEYAEKFATRIAQRRAESARKRRERRKGKRGKSNSPWLKSNWDLKKTIIKSLSEDESDFIRRSVSDGENKGDAGRKASFLAMMTDEIHRGTSLEKAVGKSIGDLGIGEYKGAAFNGGLVGAADSKSSVERTTSGALCACSSGDSTTGKVGESIRFSGDVDVSIEEKISGLELYHLLCSHGMETESVDQLTDLEKAAKAIVELNVFLASKVIFPAYMRFLEEDHPEVYTQYFERPLTPVPPQNIEGKGYLGVPYDILHLSSSEYDDEEYITGVRYNTASSAASASPPRSPGSVEKRQRSVHFDAMSTVIPPSSLDNLAHYARVMDYDADDEDTEILFSAGDEDSLEEEDDLDGSRLSVEVKDSLELLHQLSGGHSHVSGVISMLNQILDALSSGKLNEEQVQKLSQYAQEILVVTAESQPPIEKEDSITRLAQKLVEETIENATKQLVTGECTSEESYNGLAKLIVEKSIGMALDHLIASEGKKDQKQSTLPTVSTVRPSSAPPTPDKSRRETDMEGSETSCFVWDVLNKVAEEVRSEIIRTQPKPKGFTRRKKLSNSSFMVEEILQGVVQELKQATYLPEGNVDWSTAKPLKRSSASVTGQFVRDTLANVIQEMAAEGIIPAPITSEAHSSTSIFIESLVQETLLKCIQDIKTEQMELKEVQRIAAMILKSCQIQPATGASEKPRIPNYTRSQDAVIPAADRSYSSTTSILVEAFIKETLSTVRQAVEDGTISGPNLAAFATDLAEHRVGSRSTTSILAEEFVYQTLKEIAGHDPKKALALASRDSSSSNSSQIADAAVREALEALKSEIGSKITQGSSSSTSSVTAKAALKEVLALKPVKSSKSSLKSEETIKSKTLLKSDASIVAEGMVMNALGNVQWDSGELRREGSDVSTAAGDFVKRAIDGVLNELSTPVPSVNVEDQVPYDSRGTPSTISLEANNLVESVLKTVLSQVKTDSLSNAELDMVEDKVKKSVEDLIYPHKDESGHGSTGIPHTHIMINDMDEYHDDESSEDEFPIHPVLGDQVLGVNHHAVENALSIISVRKDTDLDHMNVDMDPCDPVARYSFRDIFHPDVSKVTRLSSESNPDECCRRIMSLSSRCIAVERSHVLPYDQRLVKSDCGKYVQDIRRESIDEEEEIKFVPIHTDEEFDEIVIHSEPVTSKVENKLAPAAGSASVKEPSKRDANISSTKNANSRSSVTLDKSGSKISADSSRTNSQTQNSSLQKTSRSSSMEKAKTAYDNPPFKKTSTTKPETPGKERRPAASHPNVTSKYKQDNNRRAKSVGEACVVEGEKQTSLKKKAHTPKESRNQSQSSLLKEVAKKLEDNSTTISGKEKKDSIADKVPSVPQASRASNSTGSSSKQSITASRKQSWSPATKDSGPKASCKNPENGRSSRNKVNKSPKVSRTPSREHSRASSNEPSRASSRCGAHSPQKQSSTRSCGRGSGSKQNSQTPSGKSSKERAHSDAKPSREGISIDEDAEEIPEELDVPLRRPRKKRGSGSSLSKATPVNSPSKQSYVVESHESLGQRSSQRQSRQSVNAAPRPSSGYSKSPTPPSARSSQTLGNRGFGENAGSPKRSNNSVRSHGGQRSGSLPQMAPRSSNVSGQSTDSYPKNPLTPKESKVSLVSEKSAPIFGSPSSFTASDCSVTHGTTHHPVDKALISQPSLSSRGSTFRTHHSIGSLIGHVASATARQDETSSRSCLPASQLSSGSLQ